MKKNNNYQRWLVANKLISGGNMLLSKNPNYILPIFWPTYFKKAKGIKIYDLDNVSYIDMSYMGIGTNILGYANSFVDSKVKKTISDSISSTLNCYEEVELAKNLISLHPWSERVKFARTGGEANSIAIRLSRAYTKKDKIAICGYHGWHDWYLASNLANPENLNSMLMKGIKTNGIPKYLKGSTIPFKYNDPSGFLKIAKRGDVGSLIMEVKRNYDPKENFLHEIRDICNKYKICLIFDECTSGFRENLGGIHLKYKVNPDFSIFGKALGNGYAITAILGKEKIMNSFRDTFISSTFWSERIGPVAGLATLKEMKRQKSWKIITDLGEYFRLKLRKVAKNNDLEIKIEGIPSLTTYSFIKNNQKYRTYISKKLLEKNILATNAVYFSTCHSRRNIDQYISYLDEIFYEINRDLLNKKNEINKIVKQVALNKFERLN